MNITVKKSATVKLLTGLSREVINRTESVQIVLNLSLYKNLDKMEFMQQENLQKGLIVLFMVSKDYGNMK